MSRYLVKKTIRTLATLLLVIFITFLIFEVIPGNAAQARLGMNASKEQIEKLEEEMGLNDPFPVRFFRWVANSLKGDLGMSQRFDEPVLELIRTRLLVTTEVLIITLLITIIVGIPLSILVAKYHNHFRGFMVTVLSQIGMAIPSFWLGILITLIFGLSFKWFIPSRYISMSTDFFGGLKYLFFASLSLAIPRIAVLMRYLGNALLDEMNKPYIRTALAKGVLDRQIMRRHIFKNALIPMLTVLGMMVADILGGIVIAEQIFNIPGLGKLLITGIANRDFPLVQGMVLYMSFLVIVVHVVLDIVYRMIDPRLKEEAKQ